MEKKLIDFKHLEAVLNEYGKLVQDLYKTSLTDNNRIASGRLINSVRYIYTRNDKSFSIDLNLAEYWKWIEDDTKPHFPPPNKILEWIKVKPILPHPDKNGKLPTPKQLAFLISRKKGTHDLEKVVDMVNEEYMEKIERAVILDIKDSLIF